MRMLILIVVSDMSVMFSIAYLKTAAGLAHIRQIAGIAC